MTNFRDRAFEGKAPWLPTLVEVKDDNIRAWAGWKMGSRLAREIGVRNSARMLSIVGQEQSAFANSILHSPHDRRSMLKFALGTVIGAFSLTGINSRSVAHAASRKQVQNAEVFFVSDRIPGDLFKLLESLDAQVAFSEHSVPKEALTRPAEVSRPLRKIQDIDAYATGAHTLGHIRTYRDGVEVRSIGVIDLDKRKIFRVYDSKKEE